MAVTTLTIDNYTLHRVNLNQKTYLGGTPYTGCQGLPFMGQNCNVRGERRSSIHQPLELKVLRFHTHAPWCRRHISL